MFSRMSRIANRRSRSSVIASVVATITIVLIAAVGCSKGPPLGQVSGTIRYEGEPIEQATITFTHVDEERTAFARTDANGYYELKFTDGRGGALLGENAVSIETARFGTDTEGNIVEHPETLPAKYHVDSEITRHIESGKQILDFDLTK